MDSGFKYFFDKWEGDLEDDRIPDDYEDVVDDPRSQGRFRCCHGLIDRQQPDSLKLVRLFEQKLFQQSSYPPSGQEVPEWVKDQCRCDILNFTESLLRDEHNMNRNKFLIVVKFGACMRMSSNDNDDSEIEEKEEVVEEEEEEEDIEALMEVNEQMRFGALMTMRSSDDDYADGEIEEEVIETLMEVNEQMRFGALMTMRYSHDDYDDSEMDEDIDEEILMEVNEQIGLLPASQSAIEGLEKVSGLGSSECVICLGMEVEKEKEAKRMPCGHVYHGDCIVQWLEKSHLCPFCRYAMPLDVSS